LSARLLRRELVDLLRQLINHFVSQADLLVQREFFVRIEVQAREWEGLLEPSWLSRLRELDLFDWLFRHLGHLLVSRRVLLLGDRLIEICSWRGLRFDGRLGLQFLGSCWDFLLLPLTCGRWRRASFRGHFLLGRSCLDQLGVVILAFNGCIVGLSILLSMLSGCLINWLKLDRSGCLLSLLRHNSPASHRSVPTSLPARPRAATCWLGSVAPALCLLGALLCSWWLILGTCSLSFY
jgi:hypothetical protein